MAKYCYKCGKELQETTRFCKNCGSPQNLAQTSNVVTKQKKKSLPIWATLLIVILGFLCLESFSDSSNKYYDNDITKEKVNVIFNEETIYDSHDVVMKVTGSENTSSGTKINIYIENNSDFNLMFLAYSYGVNGIMTRNNIYDMRPTVAAGKKTNSTLIIKNNILQEYGIDYIRYIDVLFWIYDKDDVVEPFKTNNITIKSDKYDGTNSWIVGNEIYNKSGIKVDYLSTDKNKIKYVVTNTSGNNLNLNFEGISINDYTVSERDYDLFNKQVLNNNQIVFEINVKNEFKKNNNIDKIDKVDFYLNYTKDNDNKKYKTDNMTTNIS